MDYALKLNQFEELSYEEMLAVDGGDILSDLNKVASGLLTAWEWFCAFSWTGPFAVALAFTAGLGDILFG